MPRFIDITGQRFGRWFVVGQVEGAKPALWRLRCDCGRDAIRPAGNLTSGASQSCGCLRALNLRNRTLTPEQAFWNRVNKNGPVVREEVGCCWVWTGGVNHGGYGSMSRKKYGQGMAHRYSWVLHNGPIAEGKLVMHACDNPACVRPEHLSLGDDRANTDDKLAKRRQARRETHGDYMPRGERHPSRTHPEKYIGEGNGSAKLTNDQVAEIKARMRRGNGSHLAREFGVSAQTIWAIRHGRLWRHILPKAG